MANPGMPTVQAKVLIVNREEFKTVDRPTKPTYLSVRKAVLCDHCGRESYHSQAMTLGTLQLCDLTCKPHNQSPAWIYLVQGEVPNQETAV
jgi:hypothetical protein